MTPERLAEIADAVSKAPRVWDDRGRPLMKPKDIMLHGPVAIGQRAELLAYVQELITTKQGE